MCKLLLDQSERVGINRTKEYARFRIHKRLEKLGDTLAGLTSDGFAGSMRDLTKDAPLAAVISLRNSVELSTMRSLGGFISGMRWGKEGLSSIEPVSSGISLKSESDKRMSGGNPKLSDIRSISSGIQCFSNFVILLGAHIPHFLFYLNNFLKYFDLASTQAAIPCESSGLKNPYPKKGHPWTLPCAQTNSFLLGASVPVGRLFGKAG